MRARADTSRSQTKKKIYLNCILWVLVAALLLIGIPQKAEPPLPDLYTAQEAQYPLFASLSFLCFAKEAHTLSCEGEVLKRKAGKAAKGEALLWGYDSGLSKEVA